MSGRARPERRPAASRPGLSAPDGAVQSPPKLPAAEPERPQKASKTPKPRKVEKRRRGRKG